MALSDACFEFTETIIAAAQELLEAVEWYDDSLLIMAAALPLMRPGLLAGAILFRPFSPSCRGRSTRSACGRLQSKRQYGLTTFVSPYAEDGPERSNTRSSEQSWPFYCQRRWLVVVGNLSSVT
jgi:hypothetical protein